MCWWRGGGMSMRGKGVSELGLFVLRFKLRCFFC